MYFLRCKAVVGGPAGPAMAGPLFWPNMVSAGPQFSIIRPKTCLHFQLLFFFLKCGGPINWACSVNLPEGVKDGRYKNNYENDTCIKDWYCHIIGF